MEFSSPCDVIMKQFAIASKSVAAPEKSGKNKHLGNEYSTLKDVQGAIRLALENGGLTIMQEPVYQDGAPERSLLMRTTIMHGESGQWMTSLCIVPMKVVEPQGFGSTLSYARRYAISSIFNLPDADDDGARGMSKSLDAWKRDINAASSIDELQEIMNETKKTNDRQLIRILQTVAADKKAELTISGAESFKAPVTTREKLRTQQPSLPQKEEEF